jgi:hypothetical protein
MKFEGQFKYRDESGVNALPARIAAKSGKCRFHRGFCWFAEFGLPCDLAKR